jgi:opacity protein-like surface antigen
LDFDTDGNWSPYVGVGVVNTTADLNLAGVVEDTDTTWCISAGIDWALSDSMDFSAEYRWSEPDFALSSVTNRTIFLGINWTF